MQNCRMPLFQFVKRFHNQQETVWHPVIFHNSTATGTPQSVLVCLYVCVCPFSGMQSFLKQPPTLTQAVSNLLMLLLVKLDKLREREKKRWTNVVTKDGSAWETPVTSRLANYTLHDSSPKLGWAKMENDSWHVVGPNYPLNKWKYHWCCVLNPTVDREQQSTLTVFWLAE